MSISVCSIRVVKECDTLDSYYKLTSYVAESHLILNM